MKIAVLSRGYKRKSSGYVLATEETTMPEIGDEPFQMHQKFPDIYVAVDAKRVRGIERLQSDEETKDVDVVLLDDAFQHRYVKPGINILLVDYHRLIIYDKMLPAGRLREPLSGKNRADIVIVTKCPKDLRHGVPCAHQSHESLSFPEALLHVYRLRRCQGPLLRQDTPTP